MVNKIPHNCYPEVLEVLKKKGEFTSTMFVSQYFNWMVLLIIQDVDML